MGERTHPDDLLWLACCCGCLPILGIIKGAIIVGPITIISLFGFTGIAIILLPHDVYLTYKALLKTSLIGKNLKMMGMLLLPFALLGWPILIAFASSIFGILYGLFCPVVRTFDSDYDIIFGGFADVFIDTFKFIGEFWDFNYVSVFTYLFEIENKKSDQPFDISISQMIIGLLLASYGSIVGISILTLMWLIKLIPAIYRMYLELFKAFCKLEGYQMIMLSIFFIIAMALIPFIGLLAILYFISQGLFGGIYCAIEGYKYNISHGLKSIWSTISKVNDQTDRLICNDW